MRLGNFGKLFRLGGLNKRIDDFRRDESGVMIIFTLYLLIAMLIITGLSIDLARVEFIRTKLQNTLDRAILAASDLDNAADTDAEVKAIVLDYFNKAGLGEFITADDIVVGGDGIGSRTVQASASARVPSWFLRFAGIDDLLAPAGGAAEEQVSNIEVILVLDVSGSMFRNYNGNAYNGTNFSETHRLEDLKVAATNFVNTVLNSANSSGKITVGLVMYNGQVQIAPALLARYTMTPDAGSRCAKFADGDFDNYSDLAIAPGSTLTSYSQFDEWTGQNDVPRTRGADVQFCSNNPRQRMVLPTSDAATLISAIGVKDADPENLGQGTGMMAQGYTSIDTGVKWAAALLDPSMRSFYNSFLPTPAQGRPFDWDQDGTMKYLIVMSDGENTSQFDLRNNYKTGMSNIWVNDQGQISVYQDRSNTNNDWYRVGNTTTDITYNSNNWQSSRYSGSTNLSWQEVFARYSARWVAYNLMATVQGGGNNSTRNSIYNYLTDTGDSRSIYNRPQDANGMDDRLDDVCDVVKDAGDDHILVFTIAFSAPSRGERALEGCATNSTGDLSNPSDYYFDASNADQLNTAFSNIARKITELRLTQ